MALSTAGRDLMVAAVSGTAVTPFNTANVRTGVGDSTTAFAASQTDLQAATNKLRKAATSVNTTGNVMTIVTDFTTAEANFAWNEWATFNAATSGTMLNRVVASLGTKTSSQSWTFTTTLTFS